MITEPYRDGLVKLTGYHRIRDKRSGNLYDEAVVRPEDRQFFEDTEIPLEENEQDREAERIAELEKELARLKGGRA